MIRAYLLVLRVSTDILEDSRNENGQDPAVPRATAPFLTVSENEIDKIVSNSSGDERFRQRKLCSAE